MAGAAGGGALVTTVEDLARFLNALLTVRLFRDRDTLRQMLAFAPAPDVGGQVGYGLGIERASSRRRRGDRPPRRPAGYTTYLARLRPQGTTIALALNWNDDPTPLLIQALEALAAAHR